MPIRVRDGHTCVGHSFAAVQKCGVRTSVYLSVRNVCVGICPSVGYRHGVTGGSVIAVIVRSAVYRVSCHDINCLERGPTDCVSV